MIGRNPSNFHKEYMDVWQHWCQDTEKYCGGDGLVTVMMQGWELHPTVQLEYKHFGGNRRVRVYHFSLFRQGEHMEMPVVHNPYVNRLIRTMQLDVVPYQNGVRVAERVGG